MAKKNSDSKPMSKSKFALNIALIVLQVLIVVVAIAFSVSILLSTGYESNTDFGDSSIRLMPVLTDSMNGDKEDSFKAGDLIIVKKADKVKLSELKEGDIITYLDYVGEDLQFVTHRIVKINEIEDDNGKIIRTYTTMGDAETSGLTTTIAEGDIAGVYIGKLPGVGSAVFWLQDPTHFFLVIMLPLILLLLYNAFLVVRFVIDAKLKKQREQLVGTAAAAGVGDAPVLDEEEIKRRAIEEYLSKMQADKEAEQVPESAEVEDTAKEEPSESAIADEAVAEEKTEEKTEEKQAGEEPETAAETEKEETAESDISAEKKEITDVAPVEEKAEEKTEVKDEDAPATEAEEAVAGPAVQDVEETVVKEEEPSSEKKESVKKTAAKKPAAKKTAAKADGAKTAAKKPAAKKTAATKTAAKTAATTKTAAKSSAKTVAEKKTAKTATAAKTAKKPAAKK